MLDYIRELLSSNQLAPHGYCLLWRPELVWTHVGSDLVIGMSYISIAAALTVFVRRRSDLAFGWMFLCFAAFILACGATHLFAIWTLWHPDYGAEALVKLFTALVSVVTAGALWPLLPRALALPSPSALREANNTLAREVADHRRTEDMLRQAQKIEVIGQLTGGVAHDFNNLLTVVAGNIELIGRTLGQQANDRVARYLTNATRGVDQAKTLTSRLLAFARRQTLDPKPTDVNRLIDDMQDMQDMLARSLGENVILKTALPKPIWTVEVDPNQLESALINLTVNARDAMTSEDREGGVLTIETFNTTLDTAYADEHPDVEAGDYVAICVSDNGIGMTRDITERALEPFFTTKEVGRGTGLGLSQVYGFIRQSGGHVKIYSELGQGTSVKLYLPRFGGDHVEEPQAAAAPQDSIPHAQGETVLVVEDDAQVRSYVVESLKELGYAVLEAADGAHALDIIVTSASIDLLLTDVVMPGMTGKTLADSARAARPTLPILFMTGYARNAILNDGRLGPDVRVIAKPFSFAALAAQVRESL